MLWQQRQNFYYDRIYFFHYYPDSFRGAKRDPTSRSTRLEREAAEAGGGATRALYATGFKMRHKRITNKGHYYVLNFKESQPQRSYTVHQYIRFFHFVEMCLFAHKVHISQYIPPFFLFYSSSIVFKLNCEAP